MPARRRAPSRERSRRAPSSRDRLPRPIEGLATEPPQRESVLHLLDVEIDALREVDRRPDLAHWVLLGSLAALFWLGLTRGNLDEVNSWRAVLWIVIAGQVLC